MSAIHTIFGILSLSCLAACGKGPILDHMEEPPGGSGEGSGGLFDEDSSTGVELDTDEAPGSGGGEGSTGVQANDSDCGSSSSETGAVDETGDGTVCIWNALLGCICGGELSPTEADAFGCWCGGSGAVEVPWEFCE